MLSSSDVPPWNSTRAGVWIRHMSKSEQEDPGTSHGKGLRKRCIFYFWNCTGTLTLDSCLLQLMVIARFRTPKWCLIAMKEVLCSHHILKRWLFENTPAKTQPSFKLAKSRVKHLSYLCKRMSWFNGWTVKVALLIIFEADSMAVEPFNNIREYRQHENRTWEI